MTLTLNLQIVLKIVVDNKINEGLSEKQIYSYFQSKYGDWILYDPDHLTKIPIFMVITSIDILYRWCNNI